MFYNKYFCFHHSIKKNTHAFTSIPHLLSQWIVPSVIYMYTMLFIYCRIYLLNYWKQRPGKNPYLKFSGSVLSHTEPYQIVLCLFEFYACSIFNFVLFLLFVTYRAKSLETEREYFCMIIYVSPSQELLLACFCLWKQKEL